MITIYHNPKCGKSREGLQILQEEGRPFTIKKYLDEPFTREELIGLIAKLAITPLELVRTKESIWQENYKDRDLTDDEVIDAMVQHPILVERPIVVNDDNAVVGRPAEAIRTIL